MSALCSTSRYDQTLDLARLVLVRALSTSNTLRLRYISLALAWRVPDNCSSLVRPSQQTELKRVLQSCTNTTSLLALAWQCGKWAATAQIGVILLHLHFLLRRWCPVDGTGASCLPAAYTVLLDEAFPNSFVKRCTSLIPLDIGHCFTWVVAVA